MFSSLHSTATAACRSFPLCSSTLLGVLLGVLIGAGELLAQDRSTANPSPASFSAMAQTITTADYTVVQLRRFIKATGVVTVRERARVDANGTRTPDYEFDYLGVEGEPQGSALWQEWAQTYNEFGKLFFEHGLFRVRNLASVQQNYSLHDFGTVSRAGRPAHRIVVFPNVVDKSIWLLEVDTVTHVPLYTAEYDARLRLLSEIEAVSFSIGAQVARSSSASTGLITSWASLAAARCTLATRSVW